MRGRKGIEDRLSSNCEGIWKTPLLAMHQRRLREVWHSEEEMDDATKVVRDFDMLPWQSKPG
jgi:hypothetical protein